MTGEVERPYGNNLAGTVAVLGRGRGGAEAGEQNTWPSIHPTTRLQGVACLSPPQLPKSPTPWAQRGRVEEPCGGCLHYCFVVICFKRDI